MKTAFIDPSSTDPFFARVVTCQHWGPQHILQAEKASKLAHLGDLAVEIAGNMPKPLFMISGPMTTGGMGEYAKNIILFQHTIDEAVRAGVNVFNQTMLDEHLQRLVRAWYIQNPTEEYCDEVLTDVYELLMQSGHVRGVYFLPDWQTSRGARWEREAGERMGLEQHDYPSDWYTKAVARTNQFFAK